MLPPFSRWPFLIAVALVAAVLSDVSVERFANTGMFGAVYLDTDDSCLLPSLCAGLLLACGVIGGHLFAMCRRSRAGRRDWLSNTATDIAAHAPLRDIPFIISLQFGALFVMESVEQFVASGQLAGGLLWLGGPLLFSISAHVSVGIICTLAAGWLLRLGLPFASLVCCVLEFALCARSVSAAAMLFVRRDAASCRHAQAIRVRHISGRAPPFCPSPI